MKSDRFHRLIPLFVFSAGAFPARVRDRAERTAIVLAGSMQRISELTLRSAADLQRLEKALRTRFVDRAGARDDGCLDHPCAD